MKSDQHNTILIVGASRGLGHAMAATFLQHGWEVIGTVRYLSSHTPLHDWPRRIPCGYAWRRSTFAMKPSWPRCRRRFPRQASICCLSMPVPPIVTHRRPLATSPPRSFTR
ncbi:hypothetical protein F7P05_07925 [Klebsiella pneumoniae]|nr:hypothetical protein F7P05_07925 [Klebsiella pneumoniae]